MNKSFLILILCLFSITVHSQNPIPLKSDVYVDDNGRLRWKENNSEVSLFGVNYTAPFAYSYRALKKLDLSLKESIDIDVYHMKRIGLDAFRIHVWDREVSDSSGNLLVNEHLDLFDYLLKKLSDNGIKTILTPIAWWGTGWPEPDIITPGFSQKNSKVELITNPNAREAQRNYLKQFINHINPYSGFAYKDDPDIIAVEIINEPRHPKDADSVTEYINEMYDVLRKAGYNKPVFYNISENWSSVQAAAVCKSKVQGVTFQWYPTGLVHNKMLEGNFLLNVNQYKIPSENIEGYNRKAKMVYEFDAADVGHSYMYPAMARSFREAGMQFAAMFSYDPAQIAWSNTEYPTHFLNLLYTPSKAISLMIAGKAFRTLPLYKNYGEYPANNTFSNFRVIYEEDLSEMNSEKEFYYSNNTKTIPVAARELEHIAGYGSSPVVNYNGTGAYFIDKQSDGVWLLEVNPDVIWLRDPFSKTSLSREVAKLYYNESLMQINLPSLKESFHLYSLNDNSEIQNAVQKQVRINPGMYLIHNDVLSQETVENYKLKFSRNNKLYTPESKQKYFVLNKTLPEAIENNKIKFEFTAVSEDSIEEARLYLRRSGWRGFQSHKLTRTGKYSYEAEILSSVLNNGLVEYCLTLKSSEGEITFPGMQLGNPDEWDFESENLWKLKIRNNIVLFDPLRDYKDLIYPHYTNSLRFFNDIKVNSAGYFVINCRLESTGANEKPFGFMNSVSEFIRQTSITGFNTIRVYARNVNNAGEKVYLNLLFTDGRCLRTELLLNKEFNELEIPLSAFKPYDRLILPDSYPLFLTKIQKTAEDQPLNKIDLNQLDFIQFTFEQNRGSEVRSETEIEIEKVSLLAK